MKTLILILLLATTAAAQQPKPPQPVWNTAAAQQPKPPPSVWNWSDAALAGSMVADEITTHRTLSRCPSCREIGLNTGPRVSLKLGVFTFVKLWEWKRPRDRSRTKWVKVALAGLFVGAAIHNMRVESQALAPR